MIEFTVTGIRYQYPMELSQEVRTQMAEKYVTGLQKGTPVVLVAEPENPMDTQAIAVYIDYERIGYIDKEETAGVHPLLDDNQQCDALVERNDGHITLFVTVPGAQVKPHVMNSRPSILPASPLGEEVRMPFTRAESTLQMIACRIMNLELQQKNVQELLKIMSHYVPLMKTSICYDENVWRNMIMKKLHALTKQSKDWDLTKEQSLMLADIYKKVRACVGDMHRTSDHWPERVFKQHLQAIKADKGITFHLYYKYCKTFLDGKDFKDADKNKMKAELERLRLWLENMPWSELRDPENLDAMALKVNYLGLSRTEIYDLFGVLLLIERIEDALGIGERGVGPLASEEAMIYWKRLEKEGFVDSKQMLLKSTSRVQAMYIAESFAKVLNLKAKWSIFEKHWGIRNLAQEKWLSIELDKQPPRFADIKRIFDTKKHYSLTD